MLGSFINECTLNHLLVMARFTCLKLKPLIGFRTLCFYLSKTFDPFTKAIPRVLCELCGKYFFNGQPKLI